MGLSICHMPGVRILMVQHGVPGMSKAEIDSFLGSGRMILRLGTLDGDGAPAIHPVWYCFLEDHIYLFTGKKSRKLENISRNSTVYFSVDTEAMPNKGVKGKGRARTISEGKERVLLGEKIVRRYVEDLESEYGKAMLGMVRGDGVVVVEIVPRYYTTWDYSKMMK